MHTIKFYGIDKNRHVSEDDKTISLRIFRNENNRTAGVEEMLRFKNISFGQ